MSIAVATRGAFEGLAIWVDRHLARLVIALLILHGALLAWISCRHSPTIDEPAHLAAGISHWQLQRFDLYRVNPPLVRMVAAIPALAAGVESDWRKYPEVRVPGSRLEFRIGDFFVAANGRRSVWLFVLGRWACIPFSILGGVICFTWARQLYGSMSGMIALSLWCFSPNVLGYGSLIGTDVPAAALGVAAMWAFWRWLSCRNFYFAVIVGFILGLAALTKTTWVILFFLLPILWFVVSSPSKRGVSQAPQLLLIVCIAIYVVNFGYAFERTFQPLRDYEFISTALAGPIAAEGDPHANFGNRFAHSWFGALPVPLPENYVLGIDVQKHDFEHPHKPSYLRGHLRAHGWWYFYLYALAIKVPLGTWVLLLLAAIVRRSGFSANWRDELVLLTTPALVLALASSQSTFTPHMRYVLPALPFLFIWLSQLGKALERGRLTISLAVAIGVLWSVASSLWVYPHSLSYFNELAGGPRNGHVHLIGSNIDWGQDLMYLEQWLRKHPEIKPLYLAYEGYFDPHFCGLDYRLPPPRPGLRKEELDASWLTPGWYAISVTCLRGYPSAVFDGGDYASGEAHLRPSRWPVEANAFRYFQWFHPVTTAGYSIYVYHINESDINLLNGSASVVIRSHNVGSAESMDDRLH